MPAFVDPVGGATYAWWAPNPLNVFQNLVPGTPAGDGDPVRVWRSDINAAHLMNSNNDARRPIYETSDPLSGTGSLIFDGSNDHLSVVIGNHASFTVGLAFRTPTLPAADVRLLWQSLTAANNIFLEVDAANQIQLGSAGTPAAITFDPVSIGHVFGTWMVVIVTVNAATDAITLRVNGIDIGSATVTADNWLGAAVGDNQTSTDPANVIYGGVAVYSSILSAPNIVLLEEYLATTFGVTLGLPEPTFSYLTYVGETGTTFSYADLPLLDHPSVSGTGEVDDDEEQLRVWLNGTELARPGTTAPGYSVDEAAQNIVLATAIVATDRLIIARQTRQDRPYVEWTDVAQLRRAEDFNLFVDQLTFIAQEIHDQAGLSELVDGVEYPDGGNKSIFSQTHTGVTGTGPFSYSTVELIPNRAILHSSQLVVIKNGDELTLTTDYTVNATTQTVTLAVALIVSDVLIVRRRTALERHWTDVQDASAFSTEVVRFQLDQVRFMIEELPQWVGIDASQVSNIRRPRRKTFVQYSGPGDRFYYGNLPRYEDGSVFVWVNGVLQEEGEDYRIDEWLMEVFFDLLSGQNILISVLSNCPVLFCGSGFGDWDFPSQQDVGPPDDDGVPSAPSAAMPQMLVPATIDSDSGGDGSIDLEASVSPNSSIRLTWNLSQFRDRVATAVTFGLFKNAGGDASDSVQVWEADASFNQVGASPITTVTDFSGTQWKISADITSFANTRLADDGVIRLLLIPTGSTSFTVWSREGDELFAGVFGPHMSFEGAPYPTPPGGGGADVSLSQPASIASSASFSDPPLLGQIDFAMGVQADGDTRWCRLTFAVNIPAGVEIVSARVRATVNLGAGGGVMQRATGSEATWGSYAGFQAALVAPAGGGFTGAGEAYADVASIIQAMADGGGASSVTLYWHGGGAPGGPPASTMASPSSATPPTLLVEYNLP